MNLDLTKLKNGFVVKEDVIINISSFYYNLEQLALNSIIIKTNSKPLQYTINTEQKNIGPSILDTENNNELSPNYNYENDVKYNFDYIIKKHNLTIKQKIIEANNIYKKKNLLDMEIKKNIDIPIEIEKNSVLKIKQIHFNSPEIIDSVYCKIENKRIRMNLFINFDEFKKIFFITN